MLAGSIPQAVLRLYADSLCASIFPRGSQFHTLLSRARQRKGLRVFALGQRLRRFADHVATMAGTANGERVRR